MGIPENIDALLVKYDISPASLAKIANVSESSVSRWRNGGSIRKENLKGIVNYFGLTDDDILSSKAGLAAKEHGLFPDVKGARPVRGMEMGYIPLAISVHAGKPTEAEVYEERGVLVPQFLIDQDPDCYAGKSEGDCMNNVFPEGAIYVISPNKPHQNGRPEVWTIDGVDTVARRVYQTADTLLLSPDSTNPVHKDIVIRADDDHTAVYNGAIVWFQSDGEVE